MGCEGSNVTWAEKMVLNKCYFFFFFFGFGRRETLNLSNNTYLPLILTNVGYGKQTEHTLVDKVILFKPQVNKVISGQTTSKFSVITPFFFVRLWDIDNKSVTNI